MKLPDTFEVVVMSPDAVVWKGNALSLSSQNTEGTFDILPDHARFMTLLQETQVTLELQEGKQHVLHLEHAVLFFQDSKATIYIHTSS